MKDLTKHMSVLEQCSTSSLTLQVIIDEKARGLETNATSSNGIIYEILEEIIKEITPVDFNKVTKELVGVVEDWRLDREKIKDTDKVILSLESRFNDCFWWKF